MTERIALGVAYHGGGFHGWQRQKETRTVQATLEEALSRIADHPVVTRAAGRTDSGVHAMGQVVHFDTTALRSDKAWTEGVNRWLPNDVAVRWVAHPGTEFDARFSAQSRTYRYLLFVDPFVNPFIESAALREHRALDPALMDESAQYLVGEHDFTSFRAAHCQSKSAMRRVTSILVGEHQGFIHIEVSANAFLYHMVRNIVGALRLVGARQRPPEWMGDLLLAKDRHQAGRMAPAHGLYLEHVGYDASYQLPATTGHTPFRQLFDRSP